MEDEDLNSLVQPLLLNRLLNHLEHLQHLNHLDQPLLPNSHDQPLHLNHLVQFLLAQVLLESNL